MEANYSSGAIFIVLTACGGSNRLTLIHRQEPTPAAGKSTK